MNFLGVGGFLKISLNLNKTREDFGVFNGFAEASVDS